MKSKAIKILGVLLFSLILLLSTGMPVTTAQSVDVTLFEDDFNDGNADGWTPSAYGTWYVENGEYVVDLGLIDSYLANSTNGNTDWTDYSFSVDVYGEAGVDKVICFRFIAGTGWYSVNLRSAPFYDLVLQRYSNGVGTWLKQINYPNSTGTWYNIKIDIQGEVINVYINDILEITYTDTGTSITHGKIALAAYSGPGWGQEKVRFDNVNVSSLTPTPINIWVDPFTRTVENSEIKISWDMAIAERVEELIYKPYSTSWNLAGNHWGEFFGNAEAYGPYSDNYLPYSFVTASNTNNTWQYTKTDSSVHVIIRSKGGQGHYVTTHYLIEADSPVIAVTRTFGFRKTPINEATRIIPYNVRAFDRYHFTDYYYEKTDGSIGFSNDQCEWGCYPPDWRQTWMDVEALSWTGVPGYIGLGLVNLSSNPPSMPWFDKDGASNTSWISADIPNDGYNRDLTVTYLIIPHQGNYTEFINKMPSSKQLIVPDMKQVGEDWSGDHLGSTTYTIGGRGCYITSLANGISYLGVNDRNEVDVTPETLNDYLSSLNGGYNSDGGLANGLYVENYASGHIRIIRGLDTDFQTIDNYLDRGQPVLVMVDYDPITSGIDQHWVIITGKRIDGHYQINDPANNDTDLSYYGDEIYAARAVELSYGYHPQIQLLVHSPVELLITDPLGERIGYDPETGNIIEEIPDSQYYIEEPIAGEGGGGESVKVMYLSEPISGQYLLKIIGTGEGPYSIDLQTLDEDGIINIETISGIATSDMEIELMFDYDGHIIMQTINQPPVLEAISQQNVQYSDQLTFDVYATDPDNLGSELSYTVSGLPTGISYTDNLDGSVTISGVVFAAPETYNVEVTITDPDGLSDTETLPIIISQEDARATYLDPMLVSTGCADCSTATVPLRLTIRDISSEIGDPAYDPDPGNIKNATVTFVNRGNGLTLCTASVALLDPADPTVGTATCDWTANIGNASGLDYTIGIIVEGYYTRDNAEDNTVVVVSKPTSYFITGGGFLINQNSGGTYSGDTGLKTNFGLNVKFNKKYTNLQGRVTIMVRQDGHVYQIKTNSLTSLVVVPYDPNNPNSGTAELIAKADITDVTDPLNPISMVSGATLDAIMQDKGEPGSADLILFTLWSKNGVLLFSSNWNGVKTILQVLDGGNLAIH